MSTASDIIRIACAMDARGFAPSKSGNVSARMDNGFLVTPTGLPYGGLKPADLVQLDLDGKVLKGKQGPSSEWRFHASIYRARPEVNAIIHNHSPRATALSCARKPLPAFHYMIAIAGGHDISCADYATFGTQQLADNAVAALRDRRACLLANHGVIALGITLDAAWNVAQEVENLAGEYLDILAAGLTPVILSAAEMKRVIAKFADYGRS